MREIEIKTWEGLDVKGEKADENLLFAFEGLINLKCKKDMPIGLEMFSLMHNLSLAFDKAKEENVLKLEEREYDFLKRLLEKEVPSIWAMNKDLYSEIDKFIKLEKVI